MKTSAFTRIGLVVGVLIGAGACSGSKIEMSCPDILKMRASIPDTTTIKVGASTVAIGGAAWGGCESGPPRPNFDWKSPDSTVVRVTALDSMHARILGLRPGFARVTPVYRQDTTRSSPPSVLVTVVP